MKTILNALFSRKPRTSRKPKSRRQPVFETLEDRLAPAANILVSIDGSYPQQLLKEYTPGGTLVRSLTIPPGGSQEEARDLVADAAGNIHVYNGTFDPYLSTLSPANTWSHRTHSGWSTVNSTTYGGLGLWNNYAFATDMTTYGETADQAKGIVRFDLAGGTSTRFADTQEFIDLTVGQDGLVYALNSFRQVYVYDPQTMALQRSLTLPTTVNGSSQSYRCIAVNAAGEIFAGTTGKTVHRFNANGVPQSSLTLIGAGHPPSLGWLSDIDVSGNQLVLGSTTGHVVQMTTAFTNVSYISAGTGQAFVAFGVDAAPSLSVGDVTLAEGNSGTTTATFTVTFPPR
jgi:hypothetical protein